MEQLTQSLKDGTMNLLEVPFPVLNSGHVLVRNHFSLISAGTEGKTVKDARLGYIGKARARKEEVRKVIKTARTAGLMNTYRAVMNKLDAPSPLGYCSSGEIIEVAPDITDLKPGDRVACGGNTANHSEVIAVPRNLCVKIPEGVSMEDAAVTTLGSIALQGIRQADLKLGESCVVIGLGLVGQLTIRMLQAAGIRTIGIDIDPIQVATAYEHGADLSLHRESENLTEQIERFTEGYGVDAVIITAGTSSSDPVDLAGELCRIKGKVVIVGVVPTSFRRNNYFRKELDLRMSCSYGPGRYDAEYEEKGIDYPYGYVRWTENRNMQAFLELLRSGKINNKGIITHNFDFINAINAYNLIVDKKEHFLGILLKYDLAKQLSKTVSRDSEPSRNLDATAPVVGFIGAGSFAQNFLLPAVKGKAELKGIVTARPANARNMQDKHGFKYSSGNADDLLNDQSINTIFIATRHDTHAGYVISSLQNNKNVFVEKPLCMNEEQLEMISTAYAGTDKRLMIGFNRRFSPFIKTLIASRDQLPVAINYRINSGKISPDHWIQDPAVGGGRIIGEACHFIDLSMYLAQSPIQSVSALAMNDPQNLNDTTVISLGFENGSIASISYFSNGNKDLEKEYLEVFYSGRVAIIDDFKSMKIFGGKPAGTKLSSQDKGHKAGVEAFLESIRKGLPSPITFSDQYQVMKTTFLALQSINSNGERIYLDGK